MLYTLLVLVFAGLLCLWYLRPVQQVRLHQKHLIQAYQGRDWEKVSGFLDANYADRWGHDKAFVLQASREVFAQFVTLEIGSDVADVTTDGQKGQVSTMVRLKGMGGPGAEIVKEHVNGLQKPFTFEWARKSWKPWEWTLVRVDQPELVLDGVEL